MPNWKKVITSGSDAVLNEITASGGILTSQNIMPDADNTLSLGSSTQRFQLNGGTPVTVDGNGSSNTITRFQSATTVENSTISNSDSLTTITHDNDGNDIFIVSGSNGELIKVTDTIGDTLFQVNDGSGISQFEVSSSGTLVAQNLEYNSETFVLTYNSQSGNINFFSSSALVDTPTLDEVTDEGSTTTNTISVGGITVTSMPSGVDNSVVVLDSDNTLKTDEIDSRVWGSTLVDASNGANNRLATFSDSNSLNGEANLTFNGSTLSVTGDVDSNDVTIDDWGSVSASLASLDASIYGDSDVTDHINSLNVHSGSHLGTADTDDLDEGSTNLYYTDARVKTKLSAEGVISGSEQVEDIIGGMVTGNTETNISVTYQDSDGTLDFSVNNASTSQKGVIEIATNSEVTTGTDTSRAITPSSLTSITKLGTITTGNVNAILPGGVVSGSEQIEDVVGGMVTGNTETNISVTYQDADGTLDFSVNNATTSQKGVIEIATNAEVTTGTDTSRAITPSSLTSITKLGTVTTGNVNAILPGGVVSGSISSPSQGTISINGNNIDLGVQSGDSPTFADLTLTGNLTVEGTRTELQVTELNVEDKNITVASGAANSAAADGAGLTIDGANESLTWNHANSRFQFSDDLHTTGLLNIGSVSNAGTDTDKFLVLDSNGNVDYRTGAEVLSDIGGAGSTLTLQDVTDNGLTTTNNIQTTGNVLDAGNSTGFSKKVVFHNSASNGASSHIITSWGTATYESCVIDYVVYDSARGNKRTGTLRGTWDNNASTTIVLDETTTTDIGTTTGLTLDLEDGASGVDFTISNSTGRTMYIIAEVHWLYVV